MEVYPVQLEPTHSGWFATLSSNEKSKPLLSDITCDYLIVGGGWMGLHAARRLAELAPDAQIVLVDAGDIGNGAAGRCAGFAIDLAHNPRNKHFAEDTKGNEDEFHVNSEGIAYMQDAVEKLGIDCDWDPSGKYHAAATHRGKTCLDEMSTALNQLGKEHRWVSADEIQSITGSKHYFAAIHTPGTILIQPAKYLTQLKNKLPENVRVYEKTQVTAIDYGPQTHICTTDHGEIRARNILLCNAAYLTKCGFFQIPRFPFIPMAH
jgi:glycine/D-amino acid oxidase-like deaminating enzyme